MNWFRRLFSSRDRDAARREHQELVKVRVDAHRAIRRGMKALDRLEPHIEREARRVEHLLREGRR